MAVVRLGCNKVENEKQATDISASESRKRERQNAPDHAALDRPRRTTERDNERSLSTPATGIPHSQTRARSRRWTTISRPAGKVLVLVLCSWTSTCWNVRRRQDRTHLVLKDRPARALRRPSQVLRCLRPLRSSCTVGVRPRFPSRRVRKDIAGLPIMARVDKPLSGSARMRERT